MLTAMVDAFHMLTVLAVLAGLLIVMVATKPTVSGEDLRSIKMVYVITGILLAIATIAGLLLLLNDGIGKPTAFYSGNPVFHSKMGLFVLVVALSGSLAHRFSALLRQHPDATAETRIAVPASWRLLQKLNFVLALVMPVLAWLMARGIGY